jgi:hypothetical protein
VIPQVKEKKVQVNEEESSSMPTKSLKGLMQ